MVQVPPGLSSYLCCHMAKWLHLVLCPFKCLLNKEQMQNMDACAGYFGSSLGRQGGPRESFSLPFPSVSHTAVVIYNLTALLCTFGYLHSSQWILPVCISEPAAPLSSLLSCTTFASIIAITYSHCGSPEVT